MGAAMTGRPFQTVAIQQKICTPLGMAIIMLAAAKKLRPMMGRPTVYMWWTQRPKLRNPMATMDATMGV
jgi:hypothetical protein